MNDSRRLQNYLEELASEVEKRYEAENFEESRFPEVAASCLNNADGLDSVSVADLVPLYLSSLRESVVNQAGDFSDFPLVPCIRRHFYIQILVWTRGSTTIHQHSFSGAFRVVAGSSIQIRYAFDQSRSVNSRLRCGLVRLIDSEKLEIGHVEQILPGGRLTHSVFHLECPSITLVVRTHGEPWSGPQLLLRPPMFAVDPSALGPDRNRLLRLVDSLGDKAAPDQFEALLAGLPQDLIAYSASDLEQRFGSDLFWSNVRRRFGSQFSDDLAIAVAHERRFLAVHSLRADIETKSHRILLCILSYARDLNAVISEAERFRLLEPDSGEQIWHLVAQLLCYPDPPLKLGSLQLCEILPLLAQSSAEALGDRVDSISTLDAADRRTALKIGTLLQSSPAFSSLRRLRIPHHAGHRFHVMPVSDSRPCRSPIPEEAGRG